MTPARRLLALPTAALLLPLHGTSQAGTYRAVSVVYTAPGGTGLGTTATTSTVGPPAVSETARRDEDRVLLHVTDPSSSAIALAVDVTAPGAATVRHLACNDLSLRIRGGTTVAVTPLVGRCPDGRVSTPRSGHVDLLFHRVPPPAPKGIASPQHRFALIVGVQDYAGRTHDTVGGRGDVTAVRNALLAAGWQSSHIMTLVDAQASADGIRQGLEWLRTHSSDETFSLFHYSGHVCIESRGPCAAGHAYLWSQDNRFITDTELVQRLKSVRGKQWMDISACEGGAFDVDGYSSASRMFTGAAQPDETAYEEPHWGQSVWTGLAWDHGFTAGGADSQGRRAKATMAQMAQYGVTHAPAYTSKQSRGPQHPVFRGGAPTWSLSAPPGG